MNIQLNYLLKHATDFLNQTFKLNWGINWGISLSSFGMLFQILVQNKPDFQSHKGTVLCLWKSGLLRTKNVGYYAKKT